ncbi:hypothetical protein [Shimia sagamensis]|uniref:Uncharacterized protein n=1 Tax=Shimia sagamensis TaxID=1566352 RepID=A0ABY1PDT7_9RHOB|nr:hypothetical protein [Shimia sagamensis]SMP32272.1 hypothetical protein SAMN06265373_108154 [Shimia sagamensis]
MTPQLIKFIKKDDLKFYRQGSFRVGTNIIYGQTEAARSEAASIRFTDKEEGLGKDIYLDTHLNNQTIGGVEFQDVLIDGGVELVTSSNNLVFCASIGPYDKSHHEKMLHGCELPDGSYYPGDTDLTHYIVMDGSKLIKALYHALKKHPTWTTDSPPRQSIFAKRVEYIGRVRTHKNVPTGHNSNTQESAEDRFWRINFCKPKQFRPEHEYRIVFRPKSPHPVPDEQDYVDVKSFGLKRVINWNLSGSYRG